MKNFKVQILEKKKIKWTTNWTTSPVFEKTNDFKKKKPLIIKGFKSSEREI